MELHTYYCNNNLVLKSANVNDKPTKKRTHRDMRKLNTVGLLTTSRVKSDVLTIFLNPLISGLASSGTYYAYTTVSF
jgi:hypothetical protein